MSNFSNHLKTVADKLEIVLDEILPAVAGPQAQVIEAMRYAVLGGGKRLRPFLMVQTAGLFGKESPGVWQAASALECLHVYSLVHDDLPCMDDDDIRRGRPTVHKAYDSAIATLAGDALLTFAFEIMADEKTDREAGIRLELVSELAKAGGVHGMIGGQVMDMTLSEHARNVDIIVQLQALKTGALIEYAVMAGAILGRANVDEKQALRAYARNVGLAFQIKDDILDVEGDADIVGKAVGKDADLGKPTFVSILGLEGARNKALELGETAKRNLHGFGNTADILCDTVDFVLNRDR